MGDESVVLPDHDFIQAIATELTQRRQRFIDDLVEVTKLEIGDLDHRDELAPSLIASITENTELFIDALRDGADPRRVDALPRATEYAVRLARAGIGLAPLLRAYRVGQMMFTQLCLDVAAELEIDNLGTLRDLLAGLAEYIDYVSEVVQTAHSEELARLAATPSGLRQQWIARLLTDGHGDLGQAEAELGYPLRGPHLAVEVWRAGEEHAFEAEFASAVRVFSAAVGGAPSLAIQTGRGEGRVWFATDCEADCAAVRAALRRVGLSVHLTVAGPAEGLAGFRQTHVLATRAKRLATGLNDRPPTVTHYREVAVIALLRDDPIELRALVERTLGPLAADGEREHGLRETLRVFLECSQTPKLAAARLMVHRNTVRYRVDQAVALRGKPIDADPLDLMVALAVAKWMGPAVLLPTS